jgi:hypothetical protein
MAADEWYKEMKYMDKETGGSPVTNAQRQTAYREKTKRSGSRKDRRMEQCGFLAETTPTGAWAAIGLKQVERQMALLLTEYEEWEKEVVYAEVLEYTRRVTKKFDKIFSQMRVIEQDEIGKNPVSADGPGYR